jgi:hypothetical protein
MASYAYAYAYIRCLIVNIYDTLSPQSRGLQCVYK